jgi:flagellar secretion chaperone FliS
MTTAAQLRSRYAREAVTTASPVRLVTMLYDRLVRDLDDAELAISLANPQAAHARLRHAQDIVQELSTSLDVSQWDGGPGLQSLYTWLLERLVAANVSKDAAVVVECREVVEPLRDAWHEAANQHVAAS